MVAQLPRSFFFVPFVLSSKRATLQATGRLWLIHVYSVWSLAWSLVSALLYIVYTILCIVFSIHEVCDPASDWLLAGSLAVLFCCTFCQLSRVTVQATGRLLLISIQMYWSLAWSPEQSQGFAGEVLSWESQIQLHQATRASAWSLALFLMEVRVVA